MADPLSLAGGVIGIVTAAAKISSLLIQFIQSSKDAPRTARTVITEVNDISGILSHLQFFLLGDESSDRSRTQLLQVDQVVTIMSGCVLTFSELEQLLDGFQKQGMDFLDRAKWAKKENAIGNLIQRLQNHKGSLSLILNVLNGNTIFEAKASVDQLHGMIERCYQEISSGLETLEHRELRRSDGLPVNSYSESDTSSNVTVKGPSTHRIVPEPVANPCRKNMLYDFTEALRRSGVYRRNNALDTGRLSVYSKDRCSMTWSCLSGVSWAEVSNMSVIGLPIMLEDVYNPSRFSQTWSINPVVSNCPATGSQDQKKVSGLSGPSGPASFAYNAERIHKNRHAIALPDDCDIFQDSYDETTAMVSARAEALSRAIPLPPPHGLNISQCEKCTKPFGVDAIRRSLDSGVFNCTSCQRFTYFCITCGVKVQDIGRPALSFQRFFCLPCSGYSHCIENKYRSKLFGNLNRECWKDLQRMDTISASKGQDLCKPP